MRRRVLMGAGAVALGLGSVVATASPASAAMGPIRIELFGDPNPAPCFLNINLIIIPPICIS